MSKVKLMLGDTLDKLSEISDESVDLAVTSPPYNKVGLREGRKGHSNRWNADIAYQGYEDNMPEKDYWDWQKSIFEQIFRILKPTGSLFYNHKIRRFNGVVHHPLVELKDVSLKFYQQIIWDRTSGFDKNTTYLDISTEIILWFTKDKPNVYKNNAVFRGEIWRFQHSLDNPHPAPFPVLLPKNCILLTTKEGDLVLDPFIGSGTTALACEMLNRDCIGIDHSSEYIKLAESRIANYCADKGESARPLPHNLSQANAF